MLFLILFYSNFATLITGRLIEVWPLEVRLYLFSRRLQSVGEGGGGLLIEMSLETNKYRNTKINDVNTTSKSDLTESVTSCACVVNLSWDRRHLVHRKCLAPAYAKLL